jgi:hypothetical protein
MLRSSKTEEIKIFKFFFLFKEGFNYLVANATLFYFFYFTDEYILHTVILLGVAWWCGREVVWTLACFGAALT